MDIRTTEIRIAQNICKLELRAYKYRELCSVLDIEPSSGGNSKKAQIKEVERYVRLEKKGHSL